MFTKGSGLPVRAMYSSLKVPTGPSRKVQAMAPIKGGIR